MGNGNITQTIRVATLLDGANVATGTQVVANFDRLGIQVSLAGAQVAGATGTYSDGDTRWDDDSDHVGHGRFVSGRPDGQRV